MLGWEFPPFFAGGLGMVCYELTKALSKKDIKIDYIMAYSLGKNPHKFLNIFSADRFKVNSLNKNLNVNIEKIDTVLEPYGEYNNFKNYEDFLNSFGEILSYEEDSKKVNTKKLYGRDILHEVFLYAQRVKRLALKNDFDIIHSHDWTTLPAAIILKRITGKPFIAHVHITEYDKTGGYPGHPEIMKIEKWGWELADKIIAVSNFTKRRLVEQYGIDPNKIVVVHNGANEMSREINGENHSIKKTNKIVLFAGRVTLQKGPEYFIKAAKKVLEYEKNVKFIVAGTGDMLSRIIELSAEYGINQNIIFHGFYTRKEAELLFSMADVFVMPSVSEPFGIVPLEAVVKGTPTIISKQSGISEVLENSLKVDFWDTDEMAHKIICLLRYEPLKEEIKEKALIELDEKFNWDKTANKVIEVYKSLI